MFIALLTSLINNFSIVNASNHTKYISLSSQKYEIQPTLINLHPNEYSQELHYYQSAIKLNRCVGRSNTLNNFSNKISVPNKTQYLNIHTSSMI